MEFLRSRLAARYIFSEMAPSFLMGNLIFILILLMFQALRLTEFVLIHGVTLSVIAEIVLYLSTSFLPIILPMSLLFAVLLTYGRLSDESEIVAMRSVGLSMNSLMFPALVLALLVCWASAQTAFQLAPWGNRQFEVLVHNLGSQQAAGVIRPGTFSEGFFQGLVIYAGQADAKSGLLKEIFIYDERSRAVPLTIIAERGQVVKTSDPSAQRASLRLINGHVHRLQEGRHTKIRFTTYDILLSSPISTSVRQQSPQSMTLEDLQQVLKDPTLDTAKKVRLETEFHRRWALSFACLIFGCLGVGLGTRSHRRSGKSSGFVLSLMVIVGYWILHATFEGMARSQTLTPALAMWGPNIFFGILTSYLLHKNWHS